LKNVTGLASEYIHWNLDGEYGFSSVIPNHTWSSGPCGITVFAIQSLVVKLWMLARSGVAGETIQTSQGCVTRFQRYALTSIISILALAIFLSSSPSFVLVDVMEHSVAV
jgi:hypothetical protein